MEDPFGASNSGADPFAAAPMPKDDPFAVSADKPTDFDPFGSGNDPFAAPPSDPFDGVSKNIEQKSTENALNVSQIENKINKTKINETVGSD